MTIGEIAKKQIYRKVRFDTMRKKDFSGWGGIIMAGVTMKKAILHGSNLYDA